jgi:hypothetical protein
MMQVLVDKGYRGVPALPHLLRKSRQVKRATDPTEPSTSDFVALPHENLSINMERKRSKRE